MTLYMLPRTVTCAAGGYDPNAFALAEIMKVGFINADVMLTDEENQVHGFQTVLDFG